MVARAPIHHPWDAEILEAWRPRERLTVSEWANRHRMLQRAYAAEPGPWRTSRVPYLQGLMDAFVEPGIRRIIALTCARVGKTEAINNMLGFAIDQEPGPALYVYPRESDAKEECRDRITPFIEGSPRLAGHIPHAGWKTQTELNLDTMQIYMAWASSGATLIRRTIRHAFVDEIDNCDLQAGSLGDTLALVEKRLTTFKDRAKLVVVSTPTTQHARGNQLFEASDRRRYHVPCPECGAYQILTLKQLKADGERDPNAIDIQDLAYYECEHCKARLIESQKGWMLERGFWLPAAQEITERLPLDDPEIVERATFEHPDRWLPRVEGKRPATRTAGFHLSGLYSPWVRWSAFLAEFLSAKKDPEKLRVFINSGLGEPWKDAIEEADADIIRAKRESAGYDRGIVPPDARVLIIGADVQKSTIWYAIRAWGNYRQSWLIAEGSCATLGELWEITSRAYPQAGTSSVVHVRFGAIDTGHRTAEVYDFVKEHPGFYAVKGQPAKDYPVRPSRIEYSPRGSLKKRSIMLYHVNGPLFKEAIYRQLNVPDGDPGAWHVHRDTTDDYCEQVTAEHQVWKTVTRNNSKRRTLVWEPKTAHAANHLLDAEVYSMAIAEHKGVLALRPAEARPKRRQRPLASPRAFLDQSRKMPT